MTKEDIIHVVLHHKELKKRYHSGNESRNFMRVRKIAKSDY